MFSFIKRLNYRLIELKYFFRNVWFFRKNLFEYRPWDYYGVLSIMESSFQDMSTSNSKYSYHTNKDKIAKDLKVMAELCKRLREDDYGMYTMLNKESGNLPIYHSHFWKDIEKIKKHDMNLFIKIFSRKILSCWH